VGEASPADWDGGPAQIGGHKRRSLVGELRDWLLDRSRSDFTLRGLVAELAVQGVKVDYSKVWRFAHAQGLSFKKAYFPPIS
jgi:putative transposase